VTGADHPDPPIDGTVDPAFDAVREAFVANFTPADGDAGDLGAAVHVIVDGHPVVDLWGGWADVDRTRPWASDTLVNAYSVGKALTTLAVLSAVADGELDLDAAVAKAWPEFGAHGKDLVTLREALAHRAGVPGIDRPVADAEVFDFTAIADALAATVPWWEPGTAHGYHVNTFGHIVGEPLRRVTGRTVGDVLRDRITGPAGAADDARIGLPRAEHHRVADIDFIQDVPEEWRPHQGPTHLDRMRRAAYFNPQGLSGIGTVNTERWREVEVPSTNLQANARGIARVFATLLDGRSPVPSGLIAEATTAHSTGVDLVLDRESVMGLGFMLHQDGRPIGTTPTAFGHFGNGGSLGFADPGPRVAFGYVLNRPGDRWQVPRTRRLLAALRTSLGLPPA
jgi:CubicO group peptidase (beta-lactamase class C family)